METLRPPDVEATLVTLLTTTGVSVHTRVPNPRPAKFIRVSRAGGSRRNLIQDQPLVIVECWASSSVDAFAVAQDAWATLDATYNRDASLSSPVWFPDPDSTQSRYQFTAELLVPLSITA